MPILGEVPGYTVGKLGRDSWTGISVALLALPQGLAFAMVAGLPLEHGVFGSIAGLAFGAIFSGARHVSFGPSLTVAVLLLSTFVQLGISPGQRAAALSILLVLSAAILIVGAWLRLALLTRFISRSVTTGFITAAGILVAATQVKHVLGIETEDSGAFLETIISTVRAFDPAQWPALLVGCLTAGAYFGISLGPKMRTLPAAAGALVIGALAGWSLEQAGFKFVHLRELERTLTAAPSAGELDPALIGVVASTALAVALLSLLEVSLIGRSFAARAGSSFDANQHMFGLGMANIGNAFISGMPASISLPRTRLMWRLKPATAIAGVLAALFCGAVFFAIAPWIGRVPTAALAALVIAMASEVVSRHYLRVIMKSTVADSVVLCATALAGVLLRLDLALYIGAGLSIAFFLRKVGVPELSEFGITDEGGLDAPKDDKHRIPDISIVHVEGDLFFGAAEILLEQVRRICEDANLKIIVLRMKNAHHLDATCAMAIEELLRFARDRDRHIIVSGAHREIYRVFRNSGLLEVLGRENFFMDVPSNPTRSTRNALKRAQKILGGAEANIRIFVDPAKSRPAPGPAAG